MVLHQQGFNWQLNLRSAFYSLVQVNQQLHYLKEYTEKVIPRSRNNNKVHNCTLVGYRESYNRLSITFALEENLSISVNQIKIRS